MPLDYSKWDNIEISDDEDIEVHPNVDKRSFIKWNQEAIHRRRAERKEKIQQLKERDVINTQVITKLQEFIAALESSDPQNIQKVLSDMEKSAKQAKQASSKDQNNIKGQNLSFEQIIVNLFAAVQKDMFETKTPMVKENLVIKFQTELAKVVSHQKQCLVELEKEENSEKSVLTSENICKPGFDKTVISKVEEKPEPKKAPKNKSIEVLNPDALAKDGDKNSEFEGKETNSKSEDNDEYGLTEISLAFAKLKTFDESLNFISKHRYIIDEHYSDEILTHAFGQELKGDSKGSRHSVQQALIIQYCKRLGQDGVGLFFRKLNEKGNEVFKVDIEETYKILKERCKIIAAKPSQSGEKAIFQLEPTTPDAEIVVTLPTDSEEDEERRELFGALPKILQDALKNGDINVINEALGELEEQVAENALQICDQGEFLNFDVPSKMDQAAPASSE